ncbi:MAG: hypothetical protein ACRDGJ_07350 [Candidatus Limnocylindria bacterium]
MSNPEDAAADPAPVSVQLGAVVAPEDPEDWTRPLTWMAAAGMLAGPLAALAWFAVAPPIDAAGPLPATWLLAAAVASGAAAAGATQIGALRAGAGTVVAALFGGLATVIIGVVLAGERQVGSPSPTVAHATVAALAGAVGALAAGGLSALLARRAPRLVRWLAPAASGVVVSALVVGLLYLA